MSTIKWSVAGVMLTNITVLIGYTNCAQEGRSLIASAVVIELNDQEREQLTELSPAEKSTLCSAEQIFCRRFIFGDQQQDSSDIVDHCTDINSQQICVKVYEFKYNSTQAASTQNYEEAYCYNMDIKSRLGKEQRHYADNIDQAVVLALNYCTNL